MNICYSRAISAANDAYAEQRDSFFFNCTEYCADAIMQRHQGLNAPLYPTPDWMLVFMRGDKGPLESFTARNSVGASLFE